MAIGGGAPGPGGGGAERRAYTRQPLRLAARISADGAPARPGRILDFCPGGVLVHVDGLDDAYLVFAGRQVGPGDLLDVTFSSTISGRPAEHRVQGRIARLVGGGLGLSFSVCGPEAMEALEHETSAARPARAGASGATVDVARATDLMASVRHAYSIYLDSRTEVLFKKSEEALFAAARDAANNVEQNECMESMQEIDKFKASIMREFPAAALAKLDALAGIEAPPPALAADDASMRLALIDTSTFNDWLTVKNIVSKATERFRDGQYALDQRLHALTGVRNEEDDSPVGVMEICAAFQDTMQHLGAGKQARKAIYGAFDDTVVNDLASLHSGLNALLVEAGVLPDLEGPERVIQKPAEAPRRPPASAPIAPGGAPEARIAPPATAPGGAGHGAHSAHAVPQSPAAPGAPPAHAAGFAPHPAAAPEAAYPPAGPGIGAGGQTAADASAAPLQGAVTGGAETAPPAAPEFAFAPGARAVASGPQMRLGTALRAASHLGSMRRLSAGTDGGAVAPRAAEIGAARASDPLLDAMSTLRAAPDPTATAAMATTGRLDLKRRLSDALEASGASIGPAEQEAVDLISDLLDAIIGDPLISRSVKGRIKRLGLPLLHTSLTDEQFFSEEAHPARQVVNRLSRLELPEDAGETASLASLREAVDPLLDRIDAQHQSDPAVYAGVLPELDHLLEEQNRRFAESVNRAIAVQSRRAEKTPNAPSAAAFSKEMAPWHARAGRVEVGDVLALDVKGERPRQMTLAWVSDDGERMVLSNGNGTRTETRTRTELANELKAGASALVEAPSLPAMDRGMLGMLENLYGQLAHDANHDATTGLVKRLDFENRLTRALAHAREHYSGHVVWLLSVAGLDVILEKCGQKARDSLLKKLASVVERLMGEQGMVARFGAHEFAFLLEFSSQKEGEFIAERQRRTISQSRVVFKGTQYSLRAAIGLVPVTEQSESVATLMRAAEAACVAAEAGGGDQVRLGDEAAGGQDPAAAPALDLGDLLANDALELRSQPCEALTIATQGEPHTTALIGLAGEPAERTVPTAVLRDSVAEDDVRAAERWLIRATLGWMGKHRAAIVKSGGYAVRLSGASIADDTLLDFVVSELTGSRVPPAKVIFELPEPALRDPLGNGVKLIRTLKEYGCRFGICDFGSGDAKLTQLLELPVQYLKIDGGIVTNMAHDPADEALARSIVEVAGVMGKQSMAENVDDEATRERLREMDVDIGQGAVIGPPEKPAN